MIIDDLEVTLERKAIKHLYLSIDPRSAQVKIKAPLHLSEEQIRDFVQRKKSWIEQKLSAVHPEEMAEIKANHPIRHLGKTYVLDIRSAHKAEAYLEGDWLVLALKESAQAEKLLKDFRRSALQAVLEPLVTHWSRRIAVSVSSFQIRDMHTRWGSCTPRTAKVRFSLELSKKPIECIEYVVVHELAHLIEAGHSKKFYAVMASFLPDWKHRKTWLNAKKLDEKSENGVS